MKLFTLTMMLGLTTLLAACGDKAETNEATGAMSEMAGNMSGDMENMAMPADMGGRMAKGTGTVTAIDEAAGSITLDHGPIPEANWPAMTMAFKAKPELLGGVKVGDKIAFDLTLKDGADEVIAIKKQ